MPWQYCLVWLWHKSIAGGDNLISSYECLPKI